MCDGFAEAVEALKAGKAVVFPTDTVYGLGVSVEHARTPRAIYDLKQRDAGKPIAWLVGGVEALDEYGVEVPDYARALAAKHWPGALTIIVRANESVPEAFRSEVGTIGLRMPDCKTTLDLIESVGSPLATSSANVSGSPDSSSAESIDRSLLEQVAASIVNDVVSGGVASTVIDCSQGKIVVVRQGTIAVSGEATCSGSASAVD